MAATAARLACLPAGYWQDKGGRAAAMAAAKAKELLEEEEGKAAASRPPTMNRYEAVTAELAAADAPSAASPGSCLEDGVSNNRGNRVCHPPHHEVF